ncbi:MAG: 30S ribosomal protein S1 [Bdellovibrionales bacterium]|nr:30S ribosomal protein S1 [Bdellovibrionales bacterium]
MIFKKDTAESTAQQESVGKKTQIQRSALLDQLDKEDVNIEPNPHEKSYVDESKDFTKFYNENIAHQNFEVGAIVKGKIVDVDDDYVVVDVNYKSEGLIPKSEFQGAEGFVGIEIGAEVEVYIDSIENDNGMMGLSKDRADIIRVWEDISKVAKNQEIIEGTVIAKIKGGLQVDIGGVKAFLPGSQLELRPVRNLNQYLGKKYSFKIIKFNQKRGNIVLSRRVILEEERASLRTQTLDGIDKGSVVSGIVKNITDYGVFLDLGGIDGLLHITDISWSRIKHPSEKLSIGETIQVKVLKFDKEKKRVSLGLKQLHEHENPWEQIKDEIKAGAKVKGKVMSFTDYGAFVAIKEGVEGLVHISEMSWGKKVKNPSDVLKIGEEVDLQVIHVDQEQQRISFSMKRLKENPFQQWIDKYPVGHSMEVVVDSIVDFGFLVHFTDDEEVEGLIRLTDLTWSSRATKPKYQIGDKVKVAVLGFNVEEEKFQLGVKQLHKNPWDQIESLYSIGSVYKVKVVKIMDFGAFVELCDHKDAGVVEGLIHISELDTKRVAKVEDVVKIGDVLSAEIITMDKDSHKIGLSVKLVKLRQETTGSVSNEETGPMQTSSSEPEEKKESFFAKALRASIAKGKSDSKEKSEDL